jgi:hypothetical protein
MTLTGQPASSNTDSRLFVSPISRITFFTPAFTLSRSLSIVETACIVGNYMSCPCVQIAYSSSCYQIGKDKVQ